MIYCVVPPELEDELFEKLVALLRRQPGVTVILDRRTGPDRGGGATRPSMPSSARRATAAGPRASGTFPKTDVLEP